MDIKFYDALEREDDELPPAPPHHPVQPPRKRTARRWLIIGAVIAVVLVAGGSMYWFAVRKRPAPKPATAANTQQEHQLSAEEAATTKSYKSPTLNIEVTYRADWKLKESPDKTEMILTSPQVSYQRKDGARTDGVFTVKLRNGVIPDALQNAVHNAIAVKDSEVIAYVHPTEQQRQYTNVSYAGNDPNYFTFFVVSGSTAYKAGDAFGTSIDLVGQSYLFAGGYGADSNDTLAFDAVSKSAMDSTVFQQGMEIIKNLKVY